MAYEATLAASDIISIVAIVISGIALWRSESTAKDQLASEVFVAANAVISITIEIGRVTAEYFSATSSYPNNYHENSETLSEMQIAAIRINEQSLAKYSKKELRVELGKLQVNMIHANRILNRYKNTD